MNKNKMCKIISFLLLVALLATALPYMSFAAYAAAPDSYTDITAGQTKQVTISGNSKYFRFVPVVTGTYQFYSFNQTGDPYGHILDANGNQLASNDDGGGNRNFRMECLMTAGTTYYLRAFCYGNGSGSYSLTIVLANQAVEPPVGDTVELTASGTYSLFNSGLVGGDGYKYSSSSNVDDGSYTNGGYDIYASANSNTISTVDLGLSFRVGAAITERAKITIKAFDVDESSGERDLIYLVDESDGSRTKLNGYLSGRDWEWNTTTLEIPLSELEVGHTYHFELYESVSGWVVYVRTVDLLIEGEVIDPVISAYDFSASIDAYGLVSTTLYLKTNVNTTYSLEYAASIYYDQLGSALGQSIIATPDGTTKNVSFQLESGAPDGIYTVEVYVKDAQGALVLTREVQAPYSKYVQYYAVNYHPNGGSNSVPVDTTSYVSGDTAHVKYDYIPSRAGYEFLGWSTDRNAVLPEFVQDGANSFSIGASNVTLYAVWREVAADAGRITVESDTNVVLIHDATDFYQTVEFYYVAADLNPIKAMAITPIYDSAVFELVSVEWLRVATLQDIEDGTLRSVAAWAESTDINGNVYKIVLRAKALAASTVIGAEAMVQDTDGVRELRVVAKNVSVVECPHTNNTFTAFDDVHHTVTCDLCGAVRYYEHSFDHGCDTDCNDGCGYTRLPNHIPDADWHMDETNHWHVCTVCGENVDLHEHVYDGAADYLCNDCLYSRVLRGDFDFDGDVDSDDATYLLMNYFFLDEYPLNQSADMDGDGDFDPDDPLYLLSYSFFPNDYPLS